MALLEHARVGKGCARLPLLVSPERECRRPSVLAYALFLALLILCLGTAANAEPKFPPLTGRIVDEAGLLPADERKALEQELRQLEEKSTDQLIVYTTRSLQGYEIEDFGYRLGRTWQVGQKDKNNGVILIVAPTERKVRIEVGRGLEPQLTDILSKLIVENSILPAFRRGDFAGGIKAGVRDIRDVLLGDAEEVKQRAKQSVKRSSGGTTLAVTLLIVFVLVAVAIVWLQAMQAAHPARAGAARNRRRSDAAAAPAGWGASDWGSRSGGWDSGGSSDSGGGFSGGGGDFGGGGASGGW